MAKGWTDRDPAKGIPYRRTREKIELLLGSRDQGELLSYEDLLAVVLKVAERRPEDVLDALTWLHDDNEPKVHGLLPHQVREQASPRPVPPG
jgi:hypothetical protein